MVDAGCCGKFAIAGYRFRRPDRGYSTTRRKRDWFRPPTTGFASVAGGNAISEADQMAKLRLVVDTPRAVWG
jgi:hypothetical protein